MSLKAVLEGACGYYLSIGMTYEQYWFGPCGIHKAYRDASIQKAKHENWRAWLQATYIYEALCDVAPILSMRSKATKPVPFLKEPYDITEEDRRKREEKEARERYMRIKEKVAAFASEYNKKNADRKEGE